MKRTVVKFGGTSVGDFNKIKAIAQQLKARVSHGEQLIVVVSAMGKTTDQLMAQVADFTASPSEQELALLLTTGEQQTISFLTMALKEIGIQAKAMTGYQAGIKTMGHPLKSRITEIQAEPFNIVFETHDVIVVAGFQGINEANEVTTLGRGGSDTTAVALAVANNIPCEIYTDVEGVFATDPRLYKAAKQLDYVSFEEMMEMSALGAGVLETRSVELAMNYNIPIYIGKTGAKKKGTWIMSHTEILEKKAVTGIALDQHMIHVTVTHPMPNTLLLRQLFETLEHHEINVDMISQIQNVEGLQLSFTIKDSDVVQLERVFDEISESFKGFNYKLNAAYVKLSLIGSGMRDMTGVASRAFITLIDAQIPFYQTTTSEISISYVIDATNGERAAELLCNTFNL